MTSPPAAGPATASYAPRHPHLVALGFLALWIAILSLPMWTGQFLAGPWSDQFATGYATRWWGAAEWRATGRLPLWNPFMFGGVPVFAGFGDLFYPTSLLRLVLPTTTAVNVAFVGHYLLAGILTYALLRLLQGSWTGAVSGAAAYQLSGVVISYVSPGHDGKLFVTALLPAMCIGLVLAIRRRRVEGYALLGLATGLALLSPQYQMAQYALVIAGLFTLYLAFGDPGDLTPRQRWTAVAGAAGAVALGFAVSLIQVWPFVEYIPWSPRAEAGGFEWSTSYDIPWIHVPEFVLAGFNGAHESYWGPNPLKLHSEYLGLPVVALAALGAASARRRLALWVAGIGALMLLVALGDGTPFYRLWWAVVPYVDKTRAPGMALYGVAFALAILAALGVERLEQGGGRRAGTATMIVGLALALLAAAGGLGALATGWTQAHPNPYGVPNAGAAAAARGEILLGALGSGVALAILGAVIVARRTGRLPARAFAPLVIAVVATDLWRAGTPFWQWSRPEETIYAPDALIERVRRTPEPFRVLDTGVYPGTVLMRHRISQVLGYHGNELRAYDELLGGKGQWRHLGSPRLWHLLGVRYVITGDSVTLPGFHAALGPVTTAAGRTAYLLEADSAPPYAWVATAAATVDSASLVPTLLDPRLDDRRLALFDPAQPIRPPALAEMPPPSPVVATVAEWHPGQMAVTLAPAPAAPSYLVVSENWYPDWHATVDGTPARTLRGNASLITVPLPAGARRVEVAFRSSAYNRGKVITLLTVTGLVALALVPPVLARRRRG